MSQIGTELLKCNNCQKGHEHIGSPPIDTECPFCGKRLIYEIRKKPNKKKRGTYYYESYVNGCERLANDCM